MAAKRRKTVGFESSKKDDSQAIVLNHVTTRLDSLENRMNEILPVLGTVAEGVKNMGGVLVDLKEDVKGVSESFVEFRVSTADYGSRIENLEYCKKEKDKKYSDRKTRILGAMVAAMGSLAVGALLYFLGFK